MVILKLINELFFFIQETIRLLFGMLFTENQRERTLQIKKKK